MNILYDLMLDNVTGMEVLLQDITESGSFNQVTVENIAPGQIEDSLGNNSHGSDIKIECHVVGETWWQPLLSYGK